MFRHGAKVVVFEVCPTYQKKETQRYVGLRYRKERDVLCCSWADVARAIGRQWLSSHTQHPHAPDVCMGPVRFLQNILSTKNIIFFSPQNKNNEVTRNFSE